jgi:hypothetical protein
MPTRLVAASVAVILLATPAFAGKVPALSGAYIVTYNEVCQANTNTQNGGASHSEAVLATFDPGTATATLSGQDVNGALVVISGPPTGYTTSPVEGSGPYSNTKTTLTLGGVTFNIVYGAVKKGVAQSAVFNGITAGNCAASAMAVHQ